LYPIHEPFFYTEKTAQLSMFDWDQVQQGWFLYDFAQVLFGPYLFGRAGFPGGGAATVQQYTLVSNWLVTGYENVMGKNTVDRSALERMVWLRRMLYDRFCHRALQEGEIPQDMRGFCMYVVSWLDRERREEIAKKLIFGGVFLYALVKMVWGRTSR